MDQDDAPVFFECGGCLQYHPAEWSGDCTDDCAAYALRELPADAIVVTLAHQGQED